MKAAVGSPDPRVLDVGRRAAEAALELDGWVERTTGTRPLMAVFDPDVAASAAALPPAARVEAAGSPGPLVERFETLIDALGDPRGEHEALLLADVLRAYRTQALVAAGEPIPWVDQVHDYVGVRVDRFAPQALLGLADDLREALIEAGHEGELGDAIADWSEAHAAAKDDLVPLAQRYLEEARSLTNALLAGLPDATELRLEIVHDVFYNGYNEYFGGHLGECRLNGDFPWTLPQLRHTVAHEAFPGHHAISSLREAQGRAGRLTGGALLYYARTPLTPVIEGVCEVACRRLGWTWSAEAEVYERLNRYRKAVFTDLAVAINRDGMRHDEAVAAVERDAFTSRASAEARWTFLTHPLWRTSFPHYWHGTEAVRGALEVLDGAAAGDLWTALLHDQPHDLATLPRAASELAAGAESSLPAARRARP